MKKRVRLASQQKIGELTTEHVASSYGQPVLIVDGVAYEPIDLVDGQPPLLDDAEGDPEIAAWNDQVELGSCGFTKAVKTRRIERRCSAQQRRPPLSCSWPVDWDSGRGGVSIYLTRHSAV